MFNRTRRMGLGQSGIVWVDWRGFRYKMRALSRHRMGLVRVGAIDRGLDIQLSLRELLE